jgi:hypothetical protein
MPLNALQAKQKDMVAEFEKNTKDRLGQKPQGKRMKNIMIGLVETYSQSIK